MVLSNAERQKRFRERRAAIARGEKLPQQVRTSVDDALSVLFDAYRRNGVATGLDGESKDLVEFRQYALGPRNAGERASGLLELFHDDWSDGEITDQERETISRARDVVKAALLLD